MTDKKKRNEEEEEEEEEKKETIDAHRAKFAAVCKQSQLWTGIVSFFRRSDAPSKEYHRLPSDKVTELQQ